MGVRIKTKLMLDSNSYNKLIIREDDGNFFVKVSGDKLDEKFEFLSYRLTDSLKSMTDSEKIIAIVESYLENAFVNSIESSRTCLGSPGLFIKVSGSRELYIRIENKELLNRVVKMIKEKHIRDRYYYIMNSDIKNSYNIVLNKGVSCYNREFISCDDCEYRIDCEKSNGVCPKQIQFRLMFSNGKLVSFDEKFIERFIYDKLWDVGLIANVIEIVHDICLCGGEKVGTVVDGYYITCGNLKIRFNCSVFSREYVMNICNNIVNRYNNELNERDNNIKNKQLKMEGF